MRRALVYWMPVLVYAGVIFYLSSLPYVPGSGIVGLEQIDPERLLLHLVEYGIFGFLLFRAFVSTENSSFVERALLLATLIGFFYGITDEVHQYFVPLRSPSIADAISDGIGSFLGALVKRFFDFEYR
ncbi:MAG: VanZ family protein [Candidatus Hydrothermarchaeales archaeon]